MRRNVCIWKEPSAGLRKRLSTPGCLEYKRLYDEYMDTPYEAGATGRESDDGDELDRFYESLDPKDKAAIDEEMDLDELNLNVNRIISELGNFGDSIPIYTNPKPHQGYFLPARLQPGKCARKL